MSHHRKSQGEMDGKRHVFRLEDGVSRGGWLTTANDQSAEQVEEQLR